MGSYYFLPHFYNPFMLPRDLHFCEQWFTMWIWKKSLLGNQAWSSSVPSIKKCPIKTAEWDVTCLTMEDGLCTETYGAEQSKGSSQMPRLSFFSKNIIWKYIHYPSNRENCRNYWKFTVSKSQPEALKSEWEFNFLSIMKSLTCHANLGLYSWCHGESPKVLKQWINTIFISASLRNCKLSCL